MKSVRKECNREAFSQQSHQIKMKELFIYWRIFVSILSLGITQSENDNCQEFKVTGGQASYEGIVEMKYNESWVNVCNENITKTDAEQICSKIKPVAVELDEHIYSVDVYRNHWNRTPQKKKMFYNRCNFSENDEIYSQCESVLRICCQDVSEDVCSNNWKDTVFSEHQKQDQPEFHELDTYNYTGINKQKSWTKSALQVTKDQCEHNNSHKHYGSSFNCSYTCTLTQDLVFVMFRADNKTCCISNQQYEKLKSDNCSVQTLTVVNKPVPENITLQFCIAADVIQGTVSVSIEDCSHFLQPFNVSEKLKKKTKDKTDNMKSTSTTIFTSPTNKTDATKQADTDTTAETFNMVFVAVIVTVSVFVGICLAFGVIVCRKFKMIEKGREKQRPNSIANRGYAMEVFSHRIDDEEYTLISDMEIEHTSAEQFKPKLPDRDGEIGNTDNDKNPNKENDLITIAEYSLPSDSIRLGCKISQTSDYCMTTYDDPVRLKIKKDLENNDTVRCKNDYRNNDDSESNEKEGETKAVPLDSNMSEIPSDSAETGKESAGNSVFSLSKNKRDSARLNCTESVTSSAHSKQEDDGYEDGFGPLKQKSKTIESKNGDDIRQESEIVIDDSSNHDATIVDDYEDPGLMDGNFESQCSPKNLFQEHVCLSCLKPEHLTKLGIRIITDDFYEKGKKVQRCLSDPMSTSYGNSVENKIDKSCLMDTNQSKHIEHEDTLKELSVEKRERTGLSTRRCSVCHTVYDRLGNYKANVWSKCTDNVYDEFGNFKHFKHRNQIGGKRMNST